MSAAATGAAAGEEPAVVTIGGWSFRQESGGWRGHHRDGRRTGLHLTLRAARGPLGADIRPADEPLDILMIGEV